MAVRQWLAGQGPPGRDGFSPEYIAAEADADDYAYRMLNRFLDDH